MILDLFFSCYYNNMLLTLVFQQILVSHFIKVKLSNHLLFMNGCKPYGKSEREIDSSVQLIYVYRQDITMECGVNNVRV